MSSNYRYAILLLAFNVIAHASSNEADTKNHKVTPDDLLLTATLNGNVEKAWHAIQIGASVDARDEYKRSPLQLAAWKGYLDIVQLLLSKSDDDEKINTEDQNHRTPLHMAATYGHLQVVRELIQNGAMINEKDDEGKTPLHRVLEKAIRQVVPSNRDTLQLVISYLINSGADVDETAQRLLAHFSISKEWHKEKEAYHSARKQELMTHTQELPEVLAEFILGLEST